MILYNNQEISIKHFPNGESLLNKPFFLEYKQEKNVVTLKYESDIDLFHLLLVRKSLWFPCDLEITYFPYSRMDRKSEGYIFTLKSVAKFINWLDWNSVTIYEPHSDVTPALLNKCKIVDLTIPLLRKCGGDFDPEKDFVLYPDSGAQKKYTDVLKAPHELVGIKKRNFETGRIKSLEICGGELWGINGARVFIVDDLCSKGGTFILAAKQLEMFGAKQIYLVVAHCEENIFAGEIFKTDLIDHVYTTDSILSVPSDHQNSRITVTPIKLCKTPNKLYKDASLDEKWKEQEYQDHDDI